MREGTLTTRPTLTVRRLRDRPIVGAGAVAGYGPLFNAGLVYHAGAYHLFARAVRDGYRAGDGTGPRFIDYVSDIVVFTSIEGTATSTATSSRRPGSAARTALRTLGCSGSTTGARPVWS